MIAQPNLLTKTPTRTCTRCNESSPATTKFFYKSDLGKFGLTSRCIKCQSTLSKEYNSRPEVRERNRAREEEHRKNPEMRAKRNSQARTRLLCPGVKEKRAAAAKKYNSKPSNREKTARRERKYLARPGIRIRIKETRWASTGLKNSNGSKFKFTDFSLLKTTQNGVCKICMSLPSRRCKELYADHDHQTGVVRGLLCHRCNSALGLFKDKIAFFQKAIDYLHQAAVQSSPNVA